MKKKYLLFILVVFSFAFYGKSYTEVIDKYTQLARREVKNNWVKSNQGMYVAFNMIEARNINTNEKEYYFIVKVDDTSFKSFFLMKQFTMGEYLILTINNSEKIRLILDYKMSFGKFSSLSNADFDHSVLLENDVMQKIVNANSLDFELQGYPQSKFNTYKELTGSLKQKNLDIFKKFLGIPLVSRQKR